MKPNQKELNVVVAYAKIDDEDESRHETFGSDQENTQKKTYLN